MNKRSWILGGFIVAAFAAAADEAVLEEIVVTAKAAQHVSRPQIAANTAELLRTATPQIVLPPIRVEVALVPEHG
jgi:hypothetical protein